MAKLYIEGNEEDAIGQEVHVDGWGAGPFFTVREIKKGFAFLSTRYVDKIKYRIPISRCYFTRASAKRVRAWKAEREQQADGNSSNEQKVET